MSDYLGAIGTGFSDVAWPSTTRHTLPRSTNVEAGFELPYGDASRGILISSPSLGSYEIAEPEAVIPITRDAYLYETVNQFWFEKMHSFPQFLELGNILATVVRDIEVYSSYREDDRDLTVATNNADSGVSFVGLPALPATIGPQEGLILQVQISTVGPPVLEGTIDYTFDVGALSIPITGTRVVMFPYEPETPVEELLEWVTTVLTSVNGKEQRVSVRKNPRQAFRMNVRVEDSHTRRKIQTLLSGWHPGVFGVPVWPEARYLGSDAGIGDTVITVDTKYGDFRDDSLAIIWEDENTFDALEIDSHTDGTITFSSPVTQAFTGGQALVIPLRVAVTDKMIDVQRYYQNLEDINIIFRVQDNDVDLADTTAFPSYNGKVLLNESNLMSANTLPASFERQLNRLDNQTASILQTSDWPGPHIMTQKGFFSRTAQRRWEVRQLLHALRGSQVSFYLPTFYYDMICVEDITNGTDTMDIESIGYTTYIDGQAPSNFIQVELTDGTLIQHEILSSAVVSSTVERLTLDDNWTQDISIAEVAKVSYLRTARISDDQVSIVHTDAGAAQIIVNVREVIQ